METLTKEKTCPTCGDKFDCCTNNDGSCWCNDLPPIFDPDPSKSCLCPVCLKKETVYKIEEYVTNLSIEDAIKGNHKAKGLPNTGIVEGIDYYIENGFYVFKEWSHLKRGSCCGNNCKHCPFGHVNVK